MELTVIKQRDLCCAFTQADVKKYFSVGFEEFCKKRELVEKLADIIIEKAVKAGKFKECADEDRFEITLYEAEKDKYLIYLEREN